MRTELPEPQSPDRTLARFLRLLGTLDLLALAVVLLPQDTIALLHEAAGLGVLPRDATTGYLIRSTSALYALHGALLWWVSVDIARYRGLIAFLGCAAVVHGVLLVGIDMSQGMPAWWTLIEGPALAMIGMVVLLLLRRQGR